MRDIRECARLILSAEFQDAVKQQDVDSCQLLHCLKTLADAGNKFAAYLITLAADAWEKLFVLLQDYSEAKADEGLCC